jgi:monooxygenase
VPDDRVADVDVLVVGAGLSGIGAAVHLQTACPDRSYEVLEARDALGGTWDLFRYPGIRSDSDMYTLGYSFKPWVSTKGIADGPDILAYVRETAQEHGVVDRIRFGTKVVAAHWWTDEGRWTVTTEDAASGARTTRTCRFLFLCAGYYRYDAGYTPDLPGIEDFAGQVVHPQHWPADLEWSGRRVVVVGSGATAVTLVPALAREAAHVTMLQRTPTYIAPAPSVDRVAHALRGRLPDPVVSSVVRWKNLLRSTGYYQLSRRRPEVLKRLVAKEQSRHLPAGFDMAQLTPPYDPWDQRFCLAPDGDLFRALRTGTADIVTGRIATFTPAGIRLESGQQLEADVVVTATGLQLLAIGGVQLVVDGEPVALSETVGWKGTMLSGVPNLAAAIGYTNASWTLKCDLTCALVTRLLTRMRDEDLDVAVPVWGEGELPDAPFLDLTSGYVQRSVGQFPRQGERPPWRVHQNYLRDLALFRWGNVFEGLELRRLPRRAPVGIRREERETVDA